MGFRIDIRHNPSLLWLDCSGWVRLQDLYALIDAGAALAAYDGYRRLMFNLIDVDMELSYAEHIELATHASDRLYGLERVATVVAERLRTGLSEKAAQKRGLALRTFTTLEEGSRWVLT